MEHPWLFYFLFFIFGYYTCKVFYFLVAVQKSIQILKLTQAVGLLIIIKALESMHYAHNYRIFLLGPTASEQNKDAYNAHFEAEIKSFTSKYIREIIDLHGGFFSHLVEFKNWEEAMIYLEDKKDNVIEFMTKENND